MLTWVKQNQKSNYVFFFLFHVFVLDSFVQRPTNLIVYGTFTRIVPSNKEKNTGKSFQISIVFCRKIAHDELYRHICEACVFVCTIVERIVKWIELISSNSVSIQLLPYCNYLKVFLFHTHADSLSLFRFVFGSLQQQSNEMFSLRGKIIIRDQHEKRRKRKKIMTTSITTEHKKC